MKRLGWHASRLEGFGRRRFLGGAAVLLGLPVLDAFSPRTAHAQAQSVKKRLVAIYCGNGMLMTQAADPTTYWTPLKTGTDFELSPLLQYFAPIRQKITIVTNTGIPEGRPGGAGDHGAGTAATFTCVRPKRTTGSDFSLGISFDQVAAQAFKDQTRIASLQLGLSEGLNDGDGPFGAVDLKNVSWASATQPLSPTIDPGVVFDSVFAGLSPDATSVESKARLERRTSVLDYVREEEALLLPALGPSDKQRMDQYFTSVREVEQRLKVAATHGTGCGNAVRPAAMLPFAEVYKAMADLTVLALQCDATRVISIHMGCYRNDENYAFLGASRNHHSLSHYGGGSHGPNEKGEYLKICHWLCQQWAYLFSKMDEVKETTGTLLDNSIGLYSSDCGESNKHDHEHLPVLLAGTAGGVIKGGRHLTFPDGTNTAKLYLTVLQALGVKADSFGAQGNSPLALG
jgi:Protein of unknown function (DUF1552)